MKIYRYNSEKLLFETTDVLFKYKIIVSCLVIFLTVLLSSFYAEKIETERLKEKIKKKEQIIALKQSRIEEIKTPLREETYIEDLYKAIGFKLTDKEYKRFSYLALKYRDQIEEAHIPATLIFWIFYKESGFNVKAKNNTSTAKGMGQMLDGTWKMTCKMAGESTKGRFNEEKQVRMTLVYLNYLYNKYGNWKGAMSEYHGGVYHYPISFLFK